MTSPFPKFPTYREFQEEVIYLVSKSTAKVTFIDGPPGTGKSLVGMSLAFKKEHALYLCTTKPLQAQLHNDFPEFPLLMGRSNYPCYYNDASASKFPEVTCEDCMGGKKKPCASRCEYQQQKKRCLASKVAILNTTYFLTEANQVGSFSGADLVIIDECDRLEDTIVRFIEFNVNEGTLKNFNLEMPKHTTVHGWKVWAGNALPVMNEVLVRLNWVTPDSSKEEVRRTKQARSLFKKIEMLYHYLDDSWVYQEGVGKYGRTYNFKPV